MSFESKGEAAAVARPRFVKHITPRRRFQTAFAQV